MKSRQEEHEHCLIFESLNGTRYLFDAATCSVHPWPWDLTNSDIDFIYETCHGELVEYMEKKDLPEKLRKYILNWRTQAGAFGGWLDAHNCKNKINKKVNGDALPFKKTAPAWRPSPAIFSNLMLIVTDKCNLRCKYCIYSDHYEDFHTFRPLKMTWDIAKKAIDHFIQLNESPPFLSISDRKLDISFFGGEPLLESKLMHRVIEYAKKIARPRHWIEFSMTTNLTHLPISFAKYLVENDVSLMVSMDGPEFVHDLYRRDRNDQGSFSKVYKNLKKLYQLNKDYIGKRVSAAITINGNSNLVAMRDFFDSEDPLIPEISFVGLIRDLQNGSFHHKYMYDSERFLNQYNELLADYHERKRKGIPIKEGGFLYQLFELPLLGLYKRIMWIGSLKRITYTGTCTPGRRIAVDTAGTFHICERISEEFPIGNIKEGFDVALCEDVHKRYYESLPDCDKCWAKGICQACFASTGGKGEFKFTESNCNGTRAELAFQMSNLYSLLEDVPDGLSCEDLLINRYECAKQPV
jgi:uncharacterized protein